MMIYTVFKDECSIYGLEKDDPTLEDGPNGANCPSDIEDVFQFEFDQELYVKIIECSFVVNCED